MLHRILSVVVILVFALGTVVLADPPTVTIDQQATLVQLSDPVGGGPPITIGVAVTVVVDCGTATQANLSSTWACDRAT